ncbi:MAG: hypothetical protein H6836_05240 [Planctomycetes bacterium]|nr:hypothetical protein [Planctomycetota bacterium]MCB9888961.1 hypothetical protein [Planctomycetota bacterium]
MSKLIRRSSSSPASTALLITTCMAAIAATPLAQRPNIAINLTKSGKPSPLESDRGWGGGARPWDLVDHERTYSDWARGLAFTGGRGPWVEAAGPRQATIDFGADRTFDKVILWHHGYEHVPGLSSTSRISYWNGVQWIDTGARRRFGRIELGGEWSVSDEYEFLPVTGSKVRWSFDNRELNIQGQQIQHGWLYEFEVYSQQPSVARNPTRAPFPSPLQSDAGWGGGAKPWDLVDDLRTYPTWDRGLAFTGGSWDPTRAGPRQATIDFGDNRTFTKVVLWHHGYEHVPAAAATTRIEYFDGARWVAVAAARTIGRMDIGGSGWSVSDEYEFAPVTGSKVRWSFDNRELSILARQNTHGWLYAFEVLAESAHSTFGAGCAGSNGVPTISRGYTGPRLGEPFTLTVGSLPASAPVIGSYGASRKAWGGHSLPLSLDVLGMPGCQLLISADLTTPIPDRPTPTSARWTTQIPLDPNLLGRSFYQQVLVLDPSANALGVTLSNASQATIGWY